MPTPRKKPNGTWVLSIQHCGQRCKLTLGKLPKAEADHFCRNVGLLVEHVKYGGKALPQSLQSWIAELSDRHKVQLGELGLFDYRRAGMTVRQLLRAYLADYESRSDITESTKQRTRTALANRFQKLGKLTLDEIEPIQRAVSRNAEPIWSDQTKQVFTTFNSWQRNHFAPATWTRDNKLISSVGLWAVRQGICQFNPFSILPTASMINAERNEYITREMVLDAMEACILPDIRLTFALGRFAGLRTCSEIRTLKWEHIDFDQQSMTIIDSKKKTPRVMPLFENVAAELQRQQSHTGTTRFVATEQLRSTTSAANFKKVKEAVARSGQEPWARIRQNLRSSCENDLLDVFNERLVTNWIGHTVKVSRDHYQRPKPGDYQKAVATMAAKSPC